MTTSTFVLPSGIEVTTKEISLFALIHTGQIPNALLPLIKAGIAGTRVDPKEIEKTLQQDGALAQYVSFFIEYAKRCVVSPKIVEGDPGLEEINIFDLSDNDYVALFARSQFATKQAEAAELKPFRKEPGSDDQGGGHGPALEETA